MGARASCPWFVGRAPELQLLRDRLDGVIGGGSSAVVISGDAGIGKSRLVAELSDRARAAGVHVIGCSCLAVDEGGAPFGLFDDVGSAVAELLGTGGPAPAAGRSIDDPHLRSVQVLDGLRALAGTCPVLLVIEDLHSADRTTRELLSLLAVGTQIAGLMLVMTVRRDDVGRGHPVWELIGELHRADAGSHIRLGPLSLAELTEIIGGIVGHEPDATLAAAVVEQADGNPFVAEEITAAGGDVPPGLREMVLARFGRLDATAQEVLRAAAIGGRRVGHDLLARVVGGAMGSPRSNAVLAGEWGLAASLRQGVDHQLLEADGDGYRFHHAFVHAVIADDVLPGERAALHAAYGWAISEHPDLEGRNPAAALVRHWAAAGDDAAALAAALDAASNATEQLAFHEAQRYLTLALALWDKGAASSTAAVTDALPLTRQELLDRATEAASRAGDHLAASKLLEETLAEVDADAEPERAALLHERHGWCLLQRGEVDAALDAYERAVRLVDDADTHTATRARVLSASADALERAGRLAAAHERALTAIEAAIAIGSHQHESHARYTLGVAQVGTGRFTEGIEQVTAALDLAVSSDDVVHAAGAHLHLFRELVQYGRGDEMIDVAADTAARARAAGRETMAGVIDGLQVVYCYQLGRWDDAAALVRDGDPDAVDGIIHYAIGGLLDAGRGELRRAGDRLQLARSFALHFRDGRFNGLVWLGLMDLAWGRQQYAHMLRLVEEGLERTTVAELRARLLLAGLRAVISSVGAQSAIDGELDRLGVAERLIAGLRELDAEARRRHLTETSEVRAAAAHGEAALTTLRGVPDTELWADAVRRWDTAGFRLPALSARLGFAEALLARGTQGSDRERAHEQLGEAHDMATALGAAPWLTTIARSARRHRLGLGESVPLQPGPSAPGAPAYRLTPREQEVLAQLTTGRTNRHIAQELFISEKTVRVHVSNILGKLGAATRTEAADVAHRHGLL